MKLYKFTFFDFTMYAIVVLICIICVFPFLYVISVSLTDPDVYVGGKLILIPQKLSLKVYQSILRDGNFIAAVKSSLYVTVAGTLISIFATFGFSYGLTKKDLPFIKVFVVFVIFGLLFDPGIIANYMNIRSLGLLNSYWSLILPSIMVSWNVIIARAFISGIPGELEDAAKIDGCSYFGIFFIIILPLATASLATLTLFIAVGQWNQYMKPLMYITDFKKRTIQVFLRSLLVDNSASVGTSANEGNALPSETIRLASVVLAMAPIMAVYPFVQKYFVKGVMIGSVKG